MAYRSYKTIGHHWLKLLPYCIGWLADTCNSSTKTNNAYLQNSLALLPWVFSRRVLVFWSILLKKMDYFASLHCIIYHLMLHELPTELLWTILNYLEYDDITALLSIGQMEVVVTPYLQQHYRFHCHVASLLRHYESWSILERQRQDARRDIAQQLLHLLCHHVQQCSKFEQRAKFTQLLDILQNLVVQRVLCPSLGRDLDRDYASLCLDIRHCYLHTASIRGLHDPKYRRRSTKHPLAPFLPRDYTWIWRQHCAMVNEWISPKVPMVDITGLSWTSILLPTLTSLSSSTNIPTSPIPTQKLYSSSASSTLLSLQHMLLQRRKICFQFARFFGMLFDITSLYIESNLDGTFEECVRESLVSGNAEGLLLLCTASDRPVDVDMMCMSVSHAGEQLWNYLDTMNDWMETHPTPEQMARQQQQQQLGDDDTEHDQQSDPIPVSPPEWLMPDRYRVQTDTKFRLKMMNHLYQHHGWRWFQ